MHFFSQKMASRIEEEKSSGLTKKKTFSAVEMVKNKMSAQSKKNGHDLIA